MKKLFAIIILVICLLVYDGLFSNYYFGFDKYFNIAEAEEISEVVKNPYIYYDTAFEENYPKQLLGYNNEIYAVTKDKLYCFKDEIDKWMLIDVDKPVSSTMGTIKGLNYRGLKDGIIVEDYTKVISDINDDGKEIYELNINEDGKYSWVKIIEGGKFCKTIQGNIYNYQIVNYYNESMIETAIISEGDKIYISNKELCIEANDMDTKIIKSYKEDMSSAKIMNFGTDIYIYGGKFGLDRLRKTEDLGETTYSVCSIGKMENMVIKDIASSDDGHTLFVISSNNKIYRIIMPDTWIFDNSEISNKNEVYYIKNVEEKITELTINGKKYKIVKNEEEGKSYITVNDKILEKTIRDSFQYPDQITMFNKNDNYIYFWSNNSQPIRINREDDSVIFMGQRDLLRGISNLNEKLIKDKYGNIYIAKVDDKTYRYVEGYKDYNISLESNVDDIKILNHRCYAINKDGLFVFNHEGNWEKINSCDINEDSKEELIVLNKQLYALSSGKLYELNKQNNWSLIDSKINNKLSSIYYIDDNERKAYFLSEEENRNYVVIMDYGKNKWSKTKALPEINGISSLGVEGTNIYVGTRYVSDGIAYIYKSCVWTEILPQLELKNYKRDKTSNLLVEKNEVYFQISEEGKNNYGIWKLKDGIVSKIENIAEQQFIKIKIEERDIKSVTDEDVIFTLINGKIMRKVL